MTSDVTIIFLLIIGLFTQLNEAGKVRRVIIKMPLKIMHHYHHHTIIKHVHHRHMDDHPQDSSYEFIGYTIDKPVPMLPTIHSDFEQQLAGHHEESQWKGDPNVVEHEVEPPPPHEQGWEREDGRLFRIGLATALKHMAIAGTFNRPTVFRHKIIQRTT